MSINSLSFVKKHITSSSNRYKLTKSEEKTILDGRPEESYYYVPAKRRAGKPPKPVVNEDNELISEEKSLHSKYDEFIKGRLLASKSKN